MAGTKEKKEINVKNKVVKIEDADKVLPKKEEKKTSSAYSFGKAFGERLRTDKLFLLSFLVTFAFLAVMSYKVLKNSKSSYPGFVNKFISTSEPNSTSDDSDNKATVAVDEELDISDKVGIYSRVVNLSESVKINDACTIDSYKYIYQIKKDKSITKYLYNDCLGSYKVWSDSLDYVTISGTKYIGTTDVHFLFSGTSMKEADGDTYKTDDEISSIKEKVNIKGLSVTQIDNSIFILEKNNLVLVRGNSVLFNLNKDYVSKGGKLEQRVYKVDDKNYKFIVFYNNEELNCYDEAQEAEQLYKIYSITYDEEKSDFAYPKELVSRNKNEGCANWKADLEILNS